MNASEALRDGRGFFLVRPQRDDFDHVQYVFARGLSSFEGRRVVRVTRNSAFALDWFEPSGVTPEEHEANILASLRRPGFGFRPVLR